MDDSDGSVDADAGSVSGIWDNSDEVFTSPGNTVLRPVKTLFFNKIFYSAGTRRKKAYLLNREDSKTLRLYLSAQDLVLVAAMPRWEFRGQ